MKPPPFGMSALIADMGRATLKAHELAPRVEGGERLGPILTEIADETARIAALARALKQQARRLESWQGGKTRI